MDVCVGGQCQDDGRSDGSGWQIKPVRRHLEDEELWSEVQLFRIVLNLRNFF